MMNVAVAQSGGPTCAINASLVGVFKASLEAKEDIGAVFGYVNGIEGVINDSCVDLKRLITSTEDMELLKQTPSTVLGSCRYKLKNVEEDLETYQKIANNLQKRRIGAFFYIGGNDSMDTVEKLSRYMTENNIDIKVIGIPKTIDNDLCCTDHTPGFGSAAKYVTTTVQEIVRDSSVYSIDSVTIIEIMGRHAGWLTASTCVLRANGEIAPHLVYLPESKFSVEKFLEDIREQRARHKAVVIAVSEGVNLPEDSNTETLVDNFGHKYLSGVGKRLENIVRDSMHCKVRSIELNVMQRCSSHLASKTDIDEAVLIGEEGVKASLRGETGKVAVFKRISNVPYAVRVELVDAKETANKEKFFPRKWINEYQNGVTDEAIKYFLPLVQGDVNLMVKNGLPMHFKIQESILK
jgi:6-phosphofructokinase 1